MKKFVCNASQCTKYYLFNIGTSLPELEISSEQYTKKQLTIIFGNDSWVRARFSVNAFPVLR
jgi:hypothetical protein